MGFGIECVLYQIPFIFNVFSIIHFVFLILSSHFILCCVLVYFLVYCSHISQRDVTL
jgi:hypothetical protein